MRSLSIMILVCVLLAGFGISCEKTTTGVSAGSELAVPLAEIPASYGSLEAVTVAPEYRGWFQLWFQDEAGTIRIVRVQMVQNLMHKQVKTINRTPDASTEVTVDER